MYLQLDKAIKRYSWHIYERAREMLKDNYRGEGMKDSDGVFEAILLAAADPDIERDMSEGMFRFWYVLNQQYQLVKARAKLGINPPEEKPAEEKETAL